MVLPVELTSFVAAVDGGAVDLVWVTASETNNAGFEVESRRAADPAGWSKEAFVDGHGSTVSPRTYRFRIDELEPGRYAYRLKQVDFDGTFEYSDEIEALVEVPGVFVLEPAYPNPFNPSTTVRFAVAVEQEVIATLHDASGRQVRELYRGSPPANDMQSIFVDGQGLASGSYILQLKGESFATSERLMLVK
ncbi:T9SS type A sorting domain-containing protein [Bacteroidota bacterium]